MVSMCVYMRPTTLNSGYLQEYGSFAWVGTNVPVTSSLSRLAKKEKGGTEEMTQWEKHLQWKHGTLSMDIQNPSKVRPAW